MCVWGMESGTTRKISPRKGGGKGDLKGYDKRKDSKLRGKTSYVIIMSGFFMVSRKDQQEIFLRLRKSNQGGNIRGNLSKLLLFK